MSYDTDRLKLVMVLLGSAIKPKKSQAQGAMKAGAEANISHRRVNELKHHIMKIFKLNMMIHF